MARLSTAQGPAIITRERPPNRTGEGGGVAGSGMSSKGCETAGTLTTVRQPSARGTVNRRDKL